MKTDVSPQSVAQMLILNASSIRHEISTGLSFVDTSVRNLSGNRPDVPEALRIFSIGARKLNALVKALDKAQDAAISAANAGYNGTIETTFTGNHPEVVSWTKLFHDDVEKKQIFSKFHAAHSASSKAKAAVVSVLWHRFSEFMPWFLCQAAAMVSTNEKRHYVIQTAFEELGMRDSTQIHPNMFWSAAMLTGVSEADKHRIRALQPPAAVLDKLGEALLQFKTDAEVLGILLGLEIPAIENIETTLSSLAHSTEVRRELEQHKFFKLHRQIEIEHVRLTVANFLRFCSTDVEKAQFQSGFDCGLEFWRQFWDSAAVAITNEIERSSFHHA